MYILYFTFLLVTCAVVAASAQGEARESRTVQTAQGRVRGYKSEKEDVFEFFGIPYATAPTGLDRFKAPLPGPVWMQVFEATEKNIICPQIESPYVPATKMQEDCLIANIHTPNTDEKNLPVLVYVHGGAFLLGYGLMISPLSLVKSKKLIVVSFNYRLGAHGFLCLGTNGAPGNAGMKDQVALLRWVRKNIANFGGNPDDVTIVGSSAGSSSVDLLMLSDMTKGLFNKVIPESGASVSAWSVQMEPIEYAKDFAKRKNFTDSEDIAALEEYFKSATFGELTSEGLLARDDSSINFTPCLERDLGQEMFLKEAPLDILRKGTFRKMPVLSGFANMEGLIAIEHFEKRKDKMNKHFAEFLPPDMKFSSDEEKNEVAKIVKEFYFGDKPVGEETVLGYINYFSDVMFAYSHLRAAKLQVEAGSNSVYLYEYSFFSPHPEGMYPDFVKDIRGAGHCAQSVAIYDGDMDDMFENNSKEFNEMRAKMQEIWINFVTTGQPVPEGSRLPAWPPVDANRSPYMDLGEEMKLKDSLLGERAQLWDSLYEKYARTPQPPNPNRVRTEL